jgi:hypothetical protein
MERNGKRWSKHSKFWSNDEQSGKCIGNANINRGKDIHCNSAFGCQLSFRDSERFGSIYGKQCATGQYSSFCKHPGSRLSGHGSVDKYERSEWTEHTVQLEYRFKLIGSIVQQ